MSQITDVLRDLDNVQADKVKVAITDMDGVLRGKYIHIDKFRSALESGFGFCNVVFGWDSADVVYDNVDYTGWHTGYPDALVRLDVGTRRHVPWDNGVAFFLGDFYQADGESPLPVCPRQVLKKVVAAAREMGFEPMAGLEFEWFNFAESADSLHEKQFCNMQPLTPGMFGYSVLRASQRHEYFNALMDQLGEFGVPLEGLHTETGPGVYEAAIAVSDALNAADRAVLFKSSVKEIAARHGIAATFMARWNNRLPGSSGHIHQSLMTADGKNAFYAGDTNSSGMSPTMQHYLSGLIKYLPQFLPMLAPTVNSYKRLVEGFWAPTRATWGYDNRTCSNRVIRGGPKSTRIEVRLGGADINPYLALAASLAAGLQGIQEKLELKQPAVTGNGYADRDAEAYSKDLWSAAACFSESSAAHSWFGEGFVKHFTASRRWEYQQCQQAVTDWELKRYFEII